MPRARSDSDADSASAHSGYGSSYDSSSSAASIGRSESSASHELAAEREWVAGGTSSIVGAPPASAIAAAAAQDTKELDSAAPRPRPGAAANREWRASRPVTSVYDPSVDFKGLGRPSSTLGEVGARPSFAASHKASPLANAHTAPTQITPVDSMKTTPTKSEAPAPRRKQSSGCLCQ